MVVSLHGDHDLSTAGELRDTLTTAAGAVERIVVDLTPTEFLDSTILAVLLEAIVQARTRPGLGFALVIPPGSAVARTLDLVAFTMMLDQVYKRRDDALAAWRAE